MQSPRHNRLSVDYQELREFFDGNNFVDIQPLGPAPYERYRIIYRLPSLRVDASSRAIESGLTVVNLELPRNYPKEKPHAVAVEKVFHPNFGDYICIADFWTPTQKLVDIVIEIGEMLQWQKYNIRSPLNAVAAQWATKNQNLLPVGRVDLLKSTELPTIQLKGD